MKEKQLINNVTIDPIKCEDEIRSIYYNKFNDGRITFYCDTLEIIELIISECDDSCDFFQVKECGDKKKKSIALCIERNEEVLLIVPEGSFYLDENRHVKYATGKYTPLLGLWNDALFYELFLNEVIRMKNGYYDLVMANYRITIYN